MVFVLFGWLPESWAITLGCFVGWFLHRILRFRYRIVSSQLTAALPEFSPADRARLIRGFYRHLGLVLVETLRIPQARGQEVLARCEFHGLEHLRAAAEKGKGVLALAGHFGNWELGLVAASLSGYPLHAVFKEIKGAVGQYAVDRIRGTHGVRGIPRRNSIFQILRLLRQKAFIAFVLDQNVTADEGVFVEFLGRSACTMAGLAVLAQRHGTPVVPVHFYRDADLRRHHVVSLPEIPWEDVGADAAEIIRHNTQRYTRALEDIIRARPDQWLWVHRRWKTRPNATGSGASVAA